MKNLLIIILLISTLSVNAAFIENHPITITQPDGQKISCFISGDEFYQWIHDKDNFTIIRDKKTKYYVYAIKQNNEVIPSTFIIGKSNPKEIGLKPHVHPNAQILEEKRSAFYKNMEEQARLKNAKNITTSGTVNNIVIFIRFNDESEFTGTVHVYDSMFNSSHAQANSLYGYFNEVTYNQINISSTLYPQSSNATVLSYQDIYPRNYYQPYEETLNPNGYLEEERTQREHALLKRTVEFIDGQVPSGLELDFNLDGYVDNVCFIISGDVDEWAELLWPHRWALYTEEAYINGLQVWDFNFQIESFFFMPTRGVGVLCHEMYHTFGAPDLYHYDMEYRYFRAVGPWDLMDRSKNPAQSMGAYMKSVYGEWIDEIPEITTPGVYSLNPISSPTNNCYKIYSPYSSNQYFVLEYRKKQDPYESSISSEGLVIYRIDSDAWGYGNADYPNNPDEVYVYRPDGIDTVTGKIDSAAFSLNSGRIAFNENSNPASNFLYEVPSEVSITDISAIGNTISFCYNCQTSVAYSENKEVLLYPNPAINQTQLTFSQTYKNITVQINDLCGKRIKKINAFDVNSLNIDLSEFSSGIYWLTIELDNKTQFLKLNKQ